MEIDLPVGHDENTRELVFSRVFAFPQAMVFQAWTDPEQLAHWWGPKGFSLSVLAMDFRVGGIWEYILHGPDGTDYPNRAVFEEIDPYQRLVMFNTGGHVVDKHLTSRLIATFDARENGCLVTLRMQFKDQSALDTAKARGAESGGQQSLERLADLLSGTD